MENLEELEFKRSDDVMAPKEEPTHEEIIQMIESGNETKHNYLLQFDGIILKDLDLIQNEQKASLG